MDPLLPPAPLDPSERVPRAAVVGARLVGVVIEEGAVVMTPHGHVFLGLSLFVGLSSRRHSPTLQASREVSAVSEDVPLSVDPEVDLVDGHIAEADPFLRLLLGRSVSGKEATVGGNSWASTCRGRFTNRGT